MEPLEKLATDLAQLGRGDPLAPGVLVSLLPNNQYYVAVHRHRDNKQHRMVVLSTKDASLASAIKNIHERLAMAWANTLPINMGTVP